MANFFDDPVPEKTLEEKPASRMPPARQVPNIFDDPKPGPPVPPPAPAFNQPFGELKPYTPSPSERIANVASDVFRGAGADPYTAGKFGRGVRDITMMTPAAVPISGADIQHYANKGDLSNAALSTLGIIPGGNIGKKAATETARVLAPNFAETGLGEVLRPAPTSEQLMKAGGQGIREFAASPQVYSPQAAKSFVRDTRASLAKAGMYPGESKGTYEALQVLEDKANTNGLITRQDLDEFRKSLSLLKKGPQAPSAMHTQSELYDAMRKTGDETLQRGIENYGAGKRTEIVETILRNSERARNPDVDLANKLRSKVQTLETRPRGFTETEVEALDRAREVGSTREKLGNTVLKYGAVPSTLAPVGAALGVGFGAVDPSFALKTTLAPAALGAAGTALKASGGAARRAAAEEAGATIAQRSPLFREAEAANVADKLYYPGSPAQDYVMRNAIAQELVRRQRGQ